MTDEAIQIPLTNEEVDAISKGIAIPGQQVAQRMAAEIRFSRMRSLPTNAEVEVEELRAKWESAPDIEAMNILAREMLFLLRRLIASRDEAEEAAKEAICTFSEEFRHLEKEKEEARHLLDHILSCIITVKQENTPEWMEYICEEINKVNEALGDPDRVEPYREWIRVLRGFAVEGK